MESAAPTGRTLGLVPALPFFAQGGDAAPSHHLCQFHWPMGARDCVDQMEEAPGARVALKEEPEAF
eukprot:7614719-Alexandrium_andersonii.AAC.1